MEADKDKIVYSQLNEMFVKSGTLFPYIKSLENIIAEFTSPSKPELSEEMQKDFKKLYEVKNLLIEINQNVKN